ncbi:MAG: PspC domain-containing protein, partial [Peptococcaceae bacterium]|nr:PspC domain-containing protein [Peptococcaceae bacterium]
MKRKIDRLRRAKAGRKFAGVCAGLGRFFGIDPLYIRLVWVLVAL